MQIGLPRVPEDLPTGQVEPSYVYRVGEQHGLAGGRHQGEDRAREIIRRASHRLERGVHPLVVVDEPAVHRVDGHVLLGLLNDAGHSLDASSSPAPGLRQPGCSSP